MSSLSPDMAVGGGLPFEVVAEVYGTDCVVAQHDPVGNPGCDPDLARALIASRLSFLEGTYDACASCKGPRPMTPSEAVRAAALGRSTTGRVCDMTIEPEH